jgi:transformation/transcription domain-associated protein
VRLTSGVLKSGVHFLSIFKDEEEKEILLRFSQIFAGMKNRNLMDMFAMCMQYIFDCMLKNDQLLTVFSNLLQTAQVVRCFADVLVNFLVTSKLDILKQPDTPASKLVLHLFQLLFVAVAKSSWDCECILQPYVSTIMDACVKNASEIEKPHGYIQLLHSMFHALSGAKFELLFREFIPTLQPCLNLLLAMVEGPIGLDLKHNVLELCLRIPARLSSLLPYLPRLMKPLVLALKGSDELIDLGLRTLEFWIDNLRPEFLEHSMADAISEINLTLWSHIQPKPYPWGEKALHLLGKLGGRNRRFLKEPLALECKEYPEHGLRIILTFGPSTQYLVPLDRCIYLAREAIMQNNSDVDASHKRHALKFLRVCLSSVLNVKGNVPGEGVVPGLLSMMLMSSIDPSRCGTGTSNMKVCLQPVFFDKSMLASHLQLK